MGRPRGCLPQRHGSGPAGSTGHRALRHLRHGPARRRARRPADPASCTTTRARREETDRVNEAGGAAVGGARLPDAALLGPAKARLAAARARRARPGARLAHQPDFIARRLAGHAVPADSSHALKTGYDLIGEAWPRDVLDAARDPGEVLPDVVRPGTRLGAVGAAAAEATGLPPARRWSPG